MKTTKNEKRYIPQSLLELLTASDYQRKDDLYCILDLIYSKQSFYKNNLQRFHGWTEIPQAAFNSLIAKKENIVAAINYLVGKGYLLRNNYYERGKKSKCYKIPQEYLASKAAVEITDKNINSRIKKRKMDMRKNRIDLKDAQSRYFKTFKIDSEGALQAAKLLALGEMVQLTDALNYKITHKQLENIIDCTDGYLYHRNMILSLKSGQELNNILHRLMVHQRQIYSINDGFLYFKRNKTNGRLDTNLTSLPSYLRRFIESDETLYNIDIKNSQPFFFYLKIKEENLIQKAERVKFGELVTSGELYEFLAKKWFRERFNPQFADQRDYVKKMLFKIFYSKTTSFLQYKEFFAQHFPTMMKFIEYTNIDQHNTLAISMQSIESFMVLNLIMPALNKIGIVPLTIHDSFVVNDSERDVVLEVIKQKFIEANGVMPSFHIDRLADEQGNFEDDLFEIENDYVPASVFA